MLIYEHFLSALKYTHTQKKNHCNVFFNFPTLKGFKKFRIFEVGQNNYFSAPLVNLSRTHSNLIYLLIMYTKKKITGVESLFFYFSFTVMISNLVSEIQQLFSCLYFVAGNFLFCNLVYPLESPLRNSCLFISLELAL